MIQPKLKSEVQGPKCGNTQLEGWDCMKHGHKWQVNKEWEQNTDLYLLMCTKVDVERLKDFNIILFCF